MRMVEIAPREAELVGLSIAGSFRAVEATADAINRRKSMVEGQPRAERRRMRRRQRMQLRKLS